MTRAFAVGLRRYYMNAAEDLLAGPLQPCRINAKLDRWSAALVPHLDEDDSAGLYPVWGLHRSILASPSTLRWSLIVSLFGVTGSSIGAYFGINRYKRNPLATGSADSRADNGRNDRTPPPGGGKNSKCCGIVVGLLIGGLIGDGIGFGVVYALGLHKTTASEYHADFSDRVVPALINAFKASVTCGLFQNTNANADAWGATIEEPLIRNMISDDWGIDGAINSLYVK